MTNALVYRSMVPPLPSCLVPPDGNGSASAQRGHSPGRYDPPAASASPQSACGKLSPLFYAFAFAGRGSWRGVGGAGTPPKGGTPPWPGPPPPKPVVGRGGGGTRCRRGSSS